MGHWTNQANGRRQLLFTVPTESQYSLYRSSFKYYSVATCKASHERPSPTAMMQLFPSLLHLSLLNGIRDITHGKILELKMLVGDFRHKHKLNFAPPPKLLIFVPRISVTHFASPGAPLDALRHALRREACQRISDEL